MTQAPHTARITTAEELLNAGDIGRCELVRGELIMISPSGYHHGRLSARIAKLLVAHVDEADIGVVLGAETGFLIQRSPDTVRAPDAAFIRKQRLAAAPRRGFFPGAPDRAVEVLSPDDTATEVLAKTNEWLQAGCVEVWLIDPERRTLAVHRADAPVRVLSDRDEFVSNDLLPGFRLRIVELFE